MMQVGSIITLLIALALGWVGFAAAPATNSPNNLYSYGGTHTFDMTPYYNTGNNNLNPVSFTVSLTRTEASSSYTFGYSIQQLNYQIISQMINISVILGTKTATNTVVNLYTNNGNKINVLKINYLVLQPIFTTYAFTYHQMSPQQDFNNGHSYNQTTTGHGPFNLAGISVWSSIIGFVATLPNNQFDLYLAVTVPSTTTIDFKVSTISNQAFHLNWILIAAYAYNTGQSSFTLRSASFSLGMLQYSASHTSTQVRTYNTLIGLRSYHITNQAFYQYLIQIKNNKIDISSNVTVDYMQYDYLLVKFALCSGGTPFLHIGQNNCYATCPVRTSTNTDYSQCHLCPTYDCYYCATTGLCTQCNSAENRELNTANNRCQPKAGFYDDGTNPLAVACNPANCLTCTSATVCLSCYTGKYLSSTTCVSCVSNCQQCTLGTNCQVCTTGYTYTASNNSCWLDCSPINNCATCSYSGSLTCDSCGTGYTLASNQCSCTTANCATCSSTACITCDTGYTLSSNTCIVDCSPINNCATCSYSGSLTCDSCDTNHALSSNQCTYSGPCSVANCATCTATNCLTCDTGYALSSNQCNVDCTPIANCLTCSYSGSLTCDSCDPSYTLSTNQCTFSGTCPVTNCATCTATNCLTCISGYGLVNNQCTVTCGDGIIMSVEGCDDSNSVSGDGCSYLCQVQQFYDCTGTPSVCEITVLSITLKQLMKDEETNSFVAIYKLQPGQHPSYNSIDWKSQLVQQSTLNLTFDSLVYDTNSGEITITAAYHQYLTNKELVLVFTPPASTPFTNISPNTITTTLNTHNNLDLYVYPESVYAQAYIVKICSIGLSIAALALFLIGYYTGKLVAIQQLIIFHIAFYGLVGIDDLSPTFYALSHLSYSKGYNIRFLETSFRINRQFYPVGLQLQLLNNYNIVFALIIVPLIIAFVILLINFFCYKNKHQTLSRYSAILLGQVSFYGLLFSLSTIILSTAIAIISIPQAIQANTYNIIIATILCLLILLYLIFMVKLPFIMGEFSQYFKQESKLSNNFYIYLLFHSIIVAITFVLFFIEPRLTLTVALLAIQLIVLVRKTPYKHRAARPILNNVSSIAILTAIFLYPYISQPIPSYATYAPFFILAILFLTLIYNFYYILVQILIKRQENKKVSAYSLENTSGINSKRNLNKNDNNQSMQKFKNSSEGSLKPTTVDVYEERKLKREQIEDMNEKEVKAHIERLNSDFVIQNPYVHAFRSNPLASRARVGQQGGANLNGGTKDRASSNLMAELLNLKDSMANIKKRPRYNQALVFDNNNE